ncbi:MAG: Gfo/Idh/MocA family oxidoreductase [Acidimicrobiales bacterium]
MSQDASKQDASRRVLVISEGVTEARWAALRALCDGAALDLCTPGRLPDLASYHAIILDGPGDLGALHGWCSTGGSLLSFPAPQGCARDAEWMATVAAPDHPATSRLPREMAITDRFSPLSRPSEGQVLVSVSAAFRDEPAVVHTPFGSGRLTISALGQTTEALAHPDLARLLRRLLLCPKAAVGSSRASRGPVGLGIVGYGPYGGMGQRHGLASAATDGLELVAACDSDPSRRKAAEADFPGLRAYQSVEEMLSDDEVAVVIVATPPISHAPIAVAALEAGRHVALEKPMCLTSAEAETLMTLATKYHLTLTVNQNRRWDPDYRAAKAVLEAGLLGDLFSMETFVGSFEHPCRAWHSEESISGGAAYDWGSHYLDWSVQLMGGPPVVVTAHAHKRVWHDVTNADQVRVHLAWPDGREAVFVQSDVAAIRKPKLYLQGTSGTLAGHYRQLVTERIEPASGYIAEAAHHAEAPVELTLARYEPGRGLTETRLPPLPALPHPFHRNLADHLLLGEALAVTPESVSPVIAVLEAATASAASGGEPVRLDA